MRKFIVLAIIVSLIFSCKKETGEITPASDLNYLPLDIGNYWVYKHFDIDSSGNESETDISDSIIITKDTLIQGNTYYVFEGTNYPYNNNWGIVNILRDSSGYLVNSSGTIVFAENNFTDILVSKIEVINEDTVYFLDYKMEEMTEQVNVPAGIFDVLNYRGTVTVPENIPGVVYPRYKNNYYAKDIGKILSTYFFLYNPKKTEKRLIRYHINE